MILAAIQSFSGYPDVGMEVWKEVILAFSPVTVA
jgi:hypothetical protein